MSNPPEDTVGIAELKARLSEYLREARAGRTITVVDRSTPVAQLVPIASTGPLTVREPARRYGALADVPLPPPLALAVDPVDLLIRDRESGR